MKDDDKKQIFAAMGMVSNIGIGMVAAAAVGLFGGRYIDNWLGTSPWVTLIGIILGLAAGLWSAYKQVMRDKKPE